MTITTKEIKNAHGTFIAVTIETQIKSGPYSSQSRSTVGYQQALTRAAILWRQSLRAAGEYYNSWNSPIGWGE